MKRIGIEGLLRWTYRDELPKDGASMRLRDRPQAHGRAWDGVEAYGEMLAVIDGSENRWGLVPDFGAMTEPDPVAVLVGRAVQALDRFPIVLPADWNPLAEMGDLGALGQAAIARAVDRATHLDAAGERRLKTTASWLVKRHALLGDCPVWQAERPEVKVEMANGKPRWFRTIQLADADGVMRPVEVDGYDPKRKRPLPGAYRKSYLDPCPVDAAVARAEYEVWHAALGVLVEDVNAWCRMDGQAVEVLPCERAARPWEGGQASERRVLEAAAPVASWPLRLWLAHLRAPYSTHVLGHAQISHGPA